MEYISPTTLTVNASDRNGTTTPPTCWEFQIKHIWTLRGLALGSTLSEFSDKCRSKIYKTWAGRFANVSNSWNSTWIEYRRLAKACEPNPRPFHPVIRNQIFLSEVWWNRTSPLNGSGPEHSRGTHRFWCMLGLDPPWLRLSPDHTPSLTPARVSDDYCCRPRIDRLL